MSRGLRAILAALALAALAATALLAMLELPAVGANSSALGAVAVESSLSDRHIANTVTAVLFDLRGFDTLLEELVLFAASAGAAMLLRESRVERDEDAPDELPGRCIPPTTETVRVAAIATAAGTVVAAIAVALHGHIGPGSGFQAGVIAASAPVLAYLAADEQSFHRVASQQALQRVEAIAIGALLILAMIPWLLGQGLLASWLPAGELGKLLSGGSVPLLSAAAGVAVAGGVAMLVGDFVRQSAVIRASSDRES